MTQSTRGAKGSRSRPQPLPFSLTILLAIIVSLLSVSRDANADGSDTCPAAAIPPVLDTSGTATDNSSGTTVGRANDVATVPLACNQIYQQVAGPDVFYTLFVGAGNAFSVTVTPSRGYDPSVYLLSTCGAGNTCALGADNGLAGQPEVLTVNGLAPGRYTLGIDSFFPTNDSQSQGTFSIAFAGSLGSLPTTTTLSAAPATAVFGQSVTFTAVVTSSIGAVPAGAVTFTVGGVPHVVSVDATGTATYTTSALAVGNTTVTADYAGPAPFGASSQTISYALSKAATTTVVTSPGAIVAGTPTAFPVTVTATLPGAGTPTGTVTLSIDGVAGTPVALVNGAASVPVASLDKGTRVITATYSGDTNFNESTSGALNQVVTGAATTTTLTSTPVASVFGQPVTFTAHVASANGTPAGAVSFTIDGAAFGAPVPLNAAGDASTLALDLSVGPHTVIASYGGNAIYDISTATLTHAVSKASTTMTLATAPNPAVAYEIVTLTTTVTPAAPGAGAPSGDVIFTDNGAPIGGGTLAAGGVATLPFAFGAGAHAIAATYAGDTSFDGASAGPTTLTVNKASTATLITTSSNPSVVGQSVTFTAQVGVLPPSNGTPTGTVTFADNGTPFGTAPVAAGLATMATSALTVGTHAITATYSGDADRSASTSGALDEVINATGVIVSVTSSANPAARNTSVTFTATLTPIGTPATPTGTVTFKDGGNVIGSSGVAGGAASVSTSSLTGGPHTITAEYSGDVAFGPTSGSLVQMISASSTRTTLSATPNPTTSGTEIELVATVSGVAAAPTGVVAFVDGTSFIGSAPLSGGSASLKTKTLSIGIHLIRAVYAGGTDFTRSESPVLEVTVRAKPGPQPPEETDAGAPDADAGEEIPDAGSVPSDAGYGGNPSGYDASFPSITVGSADDSCGCRVVGGGGSESRTMLGGFAAAASLALLWSRRRRSRGLKPRR